MNELQDLLVNGFMIYPNSGKFAVRKEAVPNNKKIIAEQLFDNYELAIAEALSLLKSPQTIEWEVVVRYDQGLGIEYKNLSSVFADSLNEAKIMAKKQTELAFEEHVKICEIRVRLKNH